MSKISLRGKTTSPTLTNDMSLLMDKIFKRLGLLTLEPNLPDYLNREACAELVMSDSLVTFSRFFPNRFEMQINSETCDKKKDGSNITWYYIKDEVLGDAHLLGVLDINWTDTSARNGGLAQGVGNGYYAYDIPCIAGTLESVIGLQLNADFASLYNRQIWVDFQYPNRFALKGLGNISYDLNTFMITLLVSHVSLSTISPTVIKSFEDLAMSDIANFLYMNLRYYDGLETVYLNIDLKLAELQDVANRRDQIIETLEQNYTTTANNAIPFIFSI